MADKCAQIGRHNRKDGMQMRIRGKRKMRLIKKDPSASWADDIDDATVKWLKEHSIQDLADIVLEMAASGLDVSRETTLVVEMADLADYLGYHTEPIETYSEYDEIYRELAEEGALA